MFVTDSLPGRGPGRKQDSETIHRGARCVRAERKPEGFDPQPDLGNANVGSSYRDVCMGCATWRIPFCFASQKQKENVS